MSALNLLLLTGSSTPLGAAVAKRFARRYHVVGLDTRASGREEAADFLEADFTSEESVVEAMRAFRVRHGTHIASVVHTADYPSNAGESSAALDEVNVEGTRRLLDALHPFQVDLFVFLSTIYVHAPCPPGERITEEAPLQPRGAYARSKLEAEHLLRNRPILIPLVILRTPALYDESGLLFPLPDGVQPGAGERSDGNHASGHPLLHVDDLTEALHRLVAIRSDLPPEVTLLLGEEAPAAPALTGSRRNAFPDAAAVAEGGTEAYPLDLTRAKSLLGWSPQHTGRGIIAKHAGGGGG